MVSKRFEIILSDVVNLFKTDYHGAFKSTARCMMMTHDDITGALNVHSGSREMRQLQIHAPTRLQICTNYKTL